jgi:hypothetical protein
MTSGRASIFDEGTDQDLDLTGFEPKKARAARPAESPEKVRALSEANHFPSRAPAKPQPPPQSPPLRRGRRTGRNMQLNIKASQDTVDLFYRLTDSQGWVLGETLERALEALERELAAKSE